LASVVLRACCTIAGVGVAVMNSGQRRGGIFISYRREEMAGQAGRLYDRLSGRFGAGRVFMDVDSIDPGVDFTTAITEAISGCDILLALIGREWLTVTDAGGRRRLDDPDDLVRVEIETALRRGIRVVPVRVEGAVLPQASDLPPSLRPLVRLQALMISHAGFAAEVSHLIAAVDGLLGPGPGRATEAGRDTDASATKTGPPTGKPHAGPTVEQEEPDVARAGDTPSGLVAADDPAWLDGVSALWAGRFDEAVDHFTALQTRFPDDPKVRQRLQEALFRKDCAFWYSQGVTAAEQGDWDQAVAAFERVPSAGISDTDAYADTADRLSQARWQQRRSGLIDDVRRLHAAQRWEAAIAAGQELAKFDPATPDPDGLITQAQEALAEEVLAARYATGLRQCDSQDWQAAVDTFTGIEQDRPGYRDTPALLVQLQQRQRAADLEHRYARARAAEDSEQWAEAVGGYNGIVKIDPAYRDTTERRDLCRQRDRVIRLQSKLEEQAAAGDWPQVLASIKTLTELDPAAATQPTYAELSARARRRIAAYPSRPLRRIDVGDNVVALCWHPDGHSIAVGGLNGYAFVFDISGKETKQRLAVKSGSLRDNLSDLVLSPDGARLATGGDLGNAARIWEAASGTKLLEIRHGDRVDTVAFSPDGIWLATGSHDKTARIWDAATGEELLEVRHGNWVMAVAFSPDGIRLATGSHDKTARIWDAGSGEKLLEVRHSKWVRAVAFSPDGTRLATGSDDRTARIWDASSGEKLLEVRHGDWVRAVAFSPDGTRLATGSDDKTARIWDAASGEKLLEVRHGGYVKSVAFSPDGTQLATGSDDKSAQIWSVPEL
jgi:WD40 repeat protein/tetratricopeptide (TPR) repeat protein